MNALSISIKYQNNNIGRERSTSTVGIGKIPIFIINRL